MKFNILVIKPERIYYSFSFYKEVKEILEYEPNYKMLLVKNKSIEYLFTILRVTKKLLPELREQILYKTLILEFKEKYFIEKFEEIFPRDLAIKIQLDEIEDGLSEDNYSDLEFDPIYYTD